MREAIHKALQKEEVPDSLREMFENEPNEWEIRKILYAEKLDDRCFGVVNTTKIGNIGGWGERQWNCGYVVFPVDWHAELDWDAIAGGIECHGGITLNCSTKEYRILGYDENHIYSPPSMDSEGEVRRIHKQLLSLVSGEGEK